MTSLSLASAAADTVRLLLPISIRAVPSTTSWPFSLAEPVRNSRPIFKVDPYRISDSFKQLAGRNLRVALLADSEEVRASHQYIEVLARQQGAELRAFRDEPGALHWLAAQSQE